MWAGLAIVGLTVFGIYSCTTSEWHKANLAEERQQREAQKVPYIVSSSADGCDVYAFNPGDRWRYFTRCGPQTTTDNNYTVTRQSGKVTTTETVDETITTETHK